MSDVRKLRPGDWVAVYMDGRHYGRILVINEALRAYTLRLSNGRTVIATEEQLVALDERETAIAQAAYELGVRT